MLRALNVRLFAAMLLAAASWGAPAGAANYCVTAGSTSELQQALDAAAASAEDDIIRVEAGTYNVSAGLDYTLADDFRGGALRVLGGFDAGCITANLSTPDDTVLDGFNGSSSGFDISNTGEALELYDFSVRRSRGLVVFDQGPPCIGPRAALRAHRLRVEDNTVGSNGAGLNIASSCLSVRVENLIARRNSGSGLSVFATLPDVRVEVVHSTFTDNVNGLRYISVAGTPTGMARVANSIMRFNSGNDVLAVGAGVSLRNSMFATTSGSVSSIDTVAGDPLLDGTGRPTAGSPATGAGAYAIPGGMPVRSFDTVIRSTGDPDVGAYSTGFALPSISVTTASDGTGAGTLRTAINQANATPGRQRISFDIPGTSCRKVLLITTPLPTITDGLVMDGGTQQGANGAVNSSSTGFNAETCISIQNADAVGNPMTHAIEIDTTASDDAVILRALAFGGFGLNTDGQTGAVVVRDGRGHRVEGCQFAGDVGPFTLANNARDIVVVGPVRGMNVGGIDPARRNWFGSGGVSIRADARVVEVVGNLMGTDRTGTQGFTPAGTYGVFITDSPGNLVLANTMSGLNLSGVQVNGTTSDNNRIQDNRIGIAASGEAPLGNGRDGINIAAGDGTFIAGNTIAYNGQEGVQIQSGLGHRLDNNRIHDNDGLGIELGDDGPTPNDDDSNPLANLLPNRALNAPVLSAVSGDPLAGEISGTLSSIAGDYVVEFFASPACDASGRGEGRTPVGRVAVTLAGTGQVSTSFQAAVFPKLPLTGQFVSATAHDAAGNTSEYSTCRAWQLFPVLFSNGFE